MGSLLTEYLGLRSQNAGIMFAKLTLPRRQCWPSREDTGSHCNLLDVRLRGRCCTMASAKSAILSHHDFPSALAGLGTPVTSLVVPSSVPHEPTDREIMSCEMKARLSVSGLDRGS